MKNLGKEGFPTFWKVFFPVKKGKVFPFVKGILILKSKIRILKSVK